MAWGSAAAAGFSSQAISHSCMAASLVRQFTVVSQIHVFEEDLLQGKLASLLFQRLHARRHAISASS